MTFLILIGIVAIWLVVWEARDYIAEKRFIDQHGWCVREHRKESIEYIEASPEGKRSILLLAKLQVNRPPVWKVAVPSSQDWLLQVPDWAKSRRDEIISRLKSYPRSEIECL